ncbi:PAFAH1B2_3 [Lepeophtheirus salmonis]|uniref:PAFAH1B2_3 n=1 Tax=Lepeophtheirus salmonis TaxID=72036 RepID=A0A817F8D9_LEPSM|nr:PAFAH1B2_3 [Lepeophtheirus salmonis]CAG9475225.1 PAFAH1B2_3 [Lepeophtheirus salmonis]
MTILANKSEDYEEDGRWLSLHERFVSEARKYEPEVLWIGDYAIYHLVNSDIWNRISFKFIVFMIGSNNHGDSDDQSAACINTICALITDKQTQAYLKRSRDQFLNSDSGLVRPYVTISHHDMFDYFHLRQKGYEKVFDPVYDLLLQTLPKVKVEQKERRKRALNVQHMLPMSFYL